MFLMSSICVTTSFEHFFMRTVIVICIVVIQARQLLLMLCLSLLRIFSMLLLLWLSRQVYAGGKRDGIQGLGLLAVQQQ